MGKTIAKIELRKYLEDLSKEKLISMILEISDSYSIVEEYLTVKATNGENMWELLEEYKKKIEDEFFPKWGEGQLRLKEIKDAISGFKKVCKDKSMLIDLEIFLIENTIKFINEYDDVDDSIFDYAIDLMEEIVDEINASDSSLYDVFADRLSNVVEKSKDSYAGDYFEERYVNIYFL